MSIQEFERKVSARIQDQKNEALTQLVNTRHAPRTQTGGGTGLPTFIPAVTAEEIALRHVELSTRALAFDIAQNIVAKVFKEMTAPEQEPEKKKEKEEKKEVY